MLEAICPQCKVHYHGQALSTYQNRLCVKCGSGLIVRTDDLLVYPAFFPIKTEEYHVSSGEEEWEDLRTMNLLIYMNLN
jgi:hypothetical protein